jgi:hypothetical protein
VVDEKKKVSPLFREEAPQNCSGKGPWGSLSSVRTNKKTGSLGHTGKQHAGSNTAQGTTHVFLVGFSFPSTFALVGVHEDEDIVHTDCKHQERDNLRKKQAACLWLHNAGINRNSSISTKFIVPKHNCT